MAIRTNFDEYHSFRGDLCWCKPIEPEILRWPWLKLANWCCVQLLSPVKKKGRVGAQSELASALTLNQLLAWSWHSTGCPRCNVLCICVCVARRMHVPLLLLYECRKWMKSQSAHRDSIARNVRRLWRLTSASCPSERHHVWRMTHTHFTTHAKRESKPNFLPSQTILCLFPEAMDINCDWNHVLTNVILIQNYVNIKKYCWIFSAITFMNVDFKKHPCQCEESYSVLNI